MSEIDQVLSDKLLKLVLNYLEKNKDPETPVTHFMPPDDLKDLLDLSLPEEGSSIDQLFAVIEDYLKYSVRTGHPQFYNQLWAGFSVPGFLGDVITSLTNTSMYTYEVAPVATVMEKELVKIMGNLAGFEDPEGLLLTGGSNGNLQAMMIARNRALPEIKQQGLKSRDQLVVLVSEESHYSFEKAANILGIGMANVIKVKTDELGRMIPEELEQSIEESVNDGKTPFFVAATAGTTVKAAFDPCDEIASIARKHNLWFHVDGSFGGTVLLSPKYRHLLAGLKMADSFVWNAHKLMGLPLICSVFLLRKKGHLSRTNSVTGTDYIFHDEAYGFFDLGTMSLQCGRKVDALKLWLAWKYYGKKGYAELVDRFFDLAVYAESIVLKTPNLELMAPRSSVNVCFRYVPSGEVDLDAFNLKLREELAVKGKCLINYARVGTELSIRLVIANQDLRKADIDHFFDNLIKTAKSLK